MPAVIDLTVSSDEAETRPKKRKKESSKSRVNGKKSRQTSPTRRSASPPVFFVDLTPSSLPPAAQFLRSSSPSVKPQELLLPSHVSVFDNNTAIILAEPEQDNDEEYIEYLDFDDRKNFTRYFDDEPDESTKTTKFVCRSCGAEGDHKTIACPVKICLTCGARNEHSTFSCPVSKTCFACGMRGHLRQDCPNPQLGRSANRYDGCDRCGSYIHSTSECPMIWRQYEYSKSEERDSTLTNRQNKMHLSLGEGGEGYIAQDEWCYNCSAMGHWGDDCQDLPPVEDRPSEPSAFGNNNVASSPFFDPSRTKLASKRSSQRSSIENWQREPWNEKIPDKVGKKGRLKDMEKMKRQEKSRDELEDDPDDWFRSAANRQSREDGFRRRDNDKSRGKMSFGRLDKSKDLDKPSLLSRIGNPTSRLISSSRDQGRDRGRTGHSAKDDSRGPRYKGGYSR